MHAQSTIQRRLVHLASALLVLWFFGTLAACGSGGSTSDGTPKPSATAKPSTTPKPSATAKPAPSATPAPVYKFRVTNVTCFTDSTNTRECDGTVTNIIDKKITDTMPVMHWTGGTDSDFGTVDINPILPGQSSGFKTFTTNANPQLTQYTIGFKKVFGSESDFPVEPLPPQ